jgi:hypothetical protein
VFTDLLVYMYILSLSVACVKSGPKLSYLRYLCLFVYCCDFVLMVLVLLPVLLDCPILIASWYSLTFSTNLREIFDVTIFYDNIVTFW